MTALLATLAAALCSSSKDLVSKKIAATQPGIVSACASFFFAIPFYIVLMAIAYILSWEVFTFTSTFLVYVVLRSITDAAAEWLKMQSMVEGDISLVICFLSLAPLFLLITSPIITGDPLSVHAIIGIIVTVAGTLVITGVRLERLIGSSKYAVLLALGSSLFFSLNSCFDRLAVQHAGPILSGFSMTLVAGILLLPFAVHRYRSAPIGLPLKAFWVRGVFEVAFMVLKLYALQTYDAPVVIGIMKVSLILSIIGGAVFYKEEDMARRLKAGFLVAVGVVIIIAGEL